MICKSRIIRYRGRIGIIRDISDHLAIVEWQSVEEATEGPRGKEGGTNICPR